MGFTTLIKEKEDILLINFTNLPLIYVILAYFVKSLIMSTIHIQTYYQFLVGVYNKLS